MIVVDSSVWIEFFRGLHTPGVTKLHAIRDPGQILVGDLVLLELLQGARGDAEARRIRSVMADFPSANMLNVDIAVVAASNYRRLRASGITIRKTIKVIIATFCIENEHEILYNDRDFQHFEEHLGLRSR